ncbi:hypothetical protein LTS18_002980 [Coniosporium uncinatum]|uniref:Uncharacterized protein n=1 Tax=Coniosporium uncinatum TaxID=93489 RepID=A0ACC3DU39_9PEZI|nr:hypothetical protein LTS18_002980 [Coniosporium uncinatum]
MTKPTSDQAANNPAVIKVGEMDWESFAAESAALINSAIEPVQQDCQKLLATRSATEKNLNEMQKACNETNERLNRMENHLKEHFKQLIAQTSGSSLDGSQDQRPTDDVGKLGSGCGDYVSSRAGPATTAQAGSMLAGGLSNAVNNKIDDTTSAESSTGASSALPPKAKVPEATRSEFPDEAYMDSSDGSASPKSKIKTENGSQPNHSQAKQLQTDTLNGLQTGDTNDNKQTAKKPTQPPARKPTRSNEPAKTKTPGVKSIKNGKVIDLKHKKHAGGTTSTVKGGIISKKRKSDSDNEDGDEEEEQDTNNEQLSDDSAGADNYDPKKDKNKKNDDDDEGSAGGAPGNRRSARVKDKDTSKPSEKSKQSADAAEQRQKKGASKAGTKRCKGAAHERGSDVDDVSMFDADVDEPLSPVSGAYVFDAAVDEPKVTIFPAVLTPHEEELREEDMLHVGLQEYLPPPVEV